MAEGRSLEGKFQKPFASEESLTAAIFSAIQGVHATDLDSALNSPQGDTIKKAQRDLYLDFKTTVHDPDNTATFRTFLPRTGDSLADTIAEEAVMRCHEAIENGQKLNIEIHWVDESASE